MDVRGRSTVMKDCFRSTRQIMELATNVFYHFVPPENDPEYPEMINQKWLQKTQRGGIDWWNVHYAQIDGPIPEFFQYENRDEELSNTAEYCRKLIEEENVKPSNICIIHMNIYPVKKKMWFIELLKSKLSHLGVNISEKADASWEKSLRFITPHSFKGYDAEIVIILAADLYILGKKQGRKQLIHALYVAMTRARSILYISAIKRSEGSPSKDINDTIARCIRLMNPDTTSQEE